MPDYTWKECKKILMDQLKQGGMLVHPNSGDPISPSVLFSNVHCIDCGGNRKEGTCDCTTWWLICESTVTDIKNSLEEGLTSKAMHYLESGLHKTSEIPEDYK